MKKACNGAIGFRINENDYMIYNHFNSKQMEEKFLNIIKEFKLDNIRSIAERSWIITDKENDYDNHQRCLLLKKSRCPIDYDKKWIQFLEDNEIDYDYYYEYAFKYEDTSTFLTFSKDCEYAYILNFDTNKLEVYKGKNYVTQGSDVDGRYAKLKYDFESDGFCYGVRLIKEIDLGGL